jgi:hypothetical protein
MTNYMSPIPTYDDLVREAVNLRHERDKLLRERDAYAQTAHNNSVRNTDLRRDLAAAQARCLQLIEENNKLTGSKAGGGRPMTKTIGKTT